MPKSGFTLVELLVVIAIMALVGTYAISNYSDFGKDKKLKSAVLEIQNQLRTAQTNAGSNVKCGDKGDAVWQVQYITDSIGSLKCKKPAESLFIPVKSLRLDTLYPNIKITIVSGSPATACPDYKRSRFIVDFALLSGKVNFRDEAGKYYPKCDSLTVTLRNTEISSDCFGENSEKCKSLTIEQGGRIYAE